ncbi:hypothetical protein KFE25_002607 [Diacronema lutheri]|uniref:Uncharacterized protein n=2 Tax=Diacronema lutheri TaxID=2081491 RepID=A0A8J5XMR5_DIALT|nr:hypothetical protein KFE25_002607 [Diacronema lutheri]
MRWTLLLACLALPMVAHGFAPPAARAQARSARSALALPARPLAPASAVRMGNDAPTGPFTPVVLLGKRVLGDKVFNKVRGKLISYHSQIIGYFCEYTGAPRKMNQLLIRKAKTNGGRLGFLN